MNQIKIIFITFAVIIAIYFSFNYYTKIQNMMCYEKCADYHLSGEAAHWIFTEFLIDNGDSIWIDQECYDDWCICIDECNAGLCCEYLQ